ncbi:hypothetical protein MIR68_011768 [Amoeboaphelidium protococcarum]|nr:hypothetical protein MIR68_011768 [Amoeboaphelidium protococcarum]
MGLKKIVKQKLSSKKSLSKPDAKEMEVVEAQLFSGIQVESSKTKEPTSPDSSASETSNQSAITQSTASSSSSNGSGTSEKSVMEKDGGAVALNRIPSGFASMSGSSDGSSVSSPSSASDNDSRGKSSKRLAKSNNKTPTPVVIKDQNMSSASTQSSPSDGSDISSSSAASDAQSSQKDTGTKSKAYQIKSPLSEVSSSKSQADSSSSNQSSAVSHANEEDDENESLHSKIEKLKVKGSSDYTASASEASQVTVADDDQEWSPVKSKRTLKAERRSQRSQQSSVASSPVTSSVSSKGIKSNGKDTKARQTSSSTKRVVQASSNLPSGSSDGSSGSSNQSSRSSEISKQSRRVESKVTASSVDSPFSSSSGSQSQSSDSEISKARANAKSKNQTAGNGISPQTRQNKNNRIEQWRQTLTTEEFGAAAVSGMVADSEDQPLMNMYSSSKPKVVQSPIMGANYQQSGAAQPPMMPPAMNNYTQAQNQQFQQMQAGPYALPQYAQQLGAYGNGGGQFGPGAAAFSRHSGSSPSVGSAFDDLTPFDSISNGPDRRGGYPPMQQQGPVMPQNMMNTQQFALQQQQMMAQYAMGAGNQFMVNRNVQNMQAQHLPYNYGNQQLLQAQMMQQQQMQYGMAQRPAMMLNPQFQQQVAMRPPQRQQSGPIRPAWLDDEEPAIGGQNTLMEQVKKGRAQPQTSGKNLVAQIKYDKNTGQVPTLQKSTPAQLGQQYLQQQQYMMMLSQQQQQQQPGYPQNLQMPQYQTNFDDDEPLSNLKPR